MRFETGIPIGRGATGDVLKAWDPVLQRPVALKFLRHDDPELVQRMLLEARAQARVDHPNVCRVYETGATPEGRPWIAMQLVDGSPIDAATAGLSVERKVAVMRAVAEGVHAAHAAGLVHRDLKPANVLVERHEDGELVPYVVDFGIAREDTAEGLTLTGQIVGTPGYMSPEQARGQVRSLDRRSDVFSLGVMLYEILAERHPFPGTNAAEVILQILGDDPTPLRRVAPHVPGDLAALVDRCLEKEPARRYPSARALADDLGRYLAGEPLLVRPPTVAGRLLRKARRHPVAAAGIGLGLTVALVAGGFALATARAAEEQARLAEQFGQRVERMDSLLRLAHLLPLHDVRPDRAEVEREMADLERDMAAAGRVARGPGLFALGRGELSLGRPQRAVEKLQQAWDGGYRDARVALALGRAYARLYLDRLAAAERQASPALQEVAREEAARELSAPARSYLELAQRQLTGLAAHERDYVAGLLALAEGDTAAALAHAGAAARRGWFYEGELLAGETALRDAARHLARNALAPAAAALAVADEAFARAVSRAASNADAHLGRCRTAVARMEMELAAGREPDAPYGEVAEHCGRARAVRPDLATPWELEADAGWRMAQALTRRGVDPEPVLAEALASARRALEAEPDSPDALAVLGQAHFVRAERVADIGQDPLPEFSLAVARLDEAIRRAPGDPLLHLRLGDVLIFEGQQASWLGRDPEPSWRRALAAFEAALSGPAAQPEAWRGICRTRVEIAYWRFLRGRDPGDLFHRSVDACRESLTGSSGNLQALNALGMAYWSRAEWEAATGADPRQAFTEGAATFRSALAHDPDRSSTSVNLSHLLVEYAAWRVDHGEDPTPQLDEAGRRSETYREVYPSDFHLIRAKRALVQARAHVAAATDAAAAFAEAERHAAQAARLQPSRTDEAIVLGRVLRYRAEWQLGRGAAGRQAAERDATHGLEPLATALRIDPDSGAGLAEQAALEAVLAKVAGTPGARQRWREAARRSARRAIELRPDLADDVRRMALNTVEEDRGAPTARP